jgi:tetrahydromethanopterin S-methyltransferase subunit G
MGIDHDCLQDERIRELTKRVDKLEERVDTMKEDLNLIKKGIIGVLLTSTGTLILLLLKLKGVG